MAAGLACRDPAPIVMPASSVAMTPPADYAGFWDTLETCAGRRGDLAAVQWFQVGGAAFTGGDGLTPGEWLAPHTIVIASDQVLNGGNAYIVPRHEMLHDLLGGDAAHRDPAWLRCGVMP